MSKVEVTGMNVFRLCLGDDEPVSTNLRSWVEKMYSNDIPGCTITIIRMAGPEGIIPIPSIMSTRPETVQLSYCTHIRYF